MTKLEYIQQKEGLIIGIDNNNYLRSDGYQHLLLMAPTGAGKGVAFVIPNLLSWKESAIVHDIKLENYELTSGWRASQGQKIYLFEPLNKQGKTHCFNPLDFLSKDPNQIIDDIQKIALLLIERNGTQETSARNLFAALVLYLDADLRKPKTFGEIYRMLMSDLKEKLSDGLKELKIHNTGKMLINNFLNKDENEMTSTISTLVSFLELWANPLIDQATSKSDFNPADFRKEKTTLYVGLHPSDIKRLEPLMKFFYQYIVQNLTTHPLGDNEPHGLLFMLDEFSTLGKMNQFITCMPYFRGYKIRLMIVVQDLRDLKANYSEAVTAKILGNSTYKIIFTPSSSETANFISTLCVNRNKREVDISWEEIICLPSDQQVILADHMEPLITQKLHYYNIQEFKDKIINSVKLF